MVYPAPTSAGRAAAACTGHFSTASAVREQFVGDALCPSERVTVTLAAPPAEVAGDLGRLAVWRSHDPPYVARGCGEERRYRCLPHGDWPYRYYCARANDRSEARAASER